MTDKETEVYLWDVGYLAQQGFQCNQGQVCQICDPVHPAKELHRLDQHELCNREWLQKTEWVQETVQPMELGMHRADVLKKRIERLQESNTANFQCNKELAMIVRVLCATYGHPLPEESISRSNAAIAKGYTGVTKE